MQRNEHFNQYIKLVWDRNVFGIIMEASDIVHSLTLKKLHYTQAYHHLRTFLRMFRIYANSQGAYTLRRNAMEAKLGI